MIAARLDPADPLAALAGLVPRARLAAAARRLSGAVGGPLGRFEIGSERDPSPGAIDGRLLEAICAAALGGRAGAVFTPAPEARILAAFGLAHAAARRGGPPAPEALAGLLAGRPEAPLARALDGLRVLDPACGGGALLAAAERLAGATGARLALAGIDLSPLAARATAARLRLLGARASIRAGDALAAWPAADLVLANPPFLRHESLPRARKARAARLTGLSLRADLSAHLALLALRRAPVAALVLPRALLTARSAAPLLAEADARGGFALRLRSAAAGSFRASIDTLLAVWVEGGESAAAIEAGRPLAGLDDADLAALADPARPLHRPRLARVGRPPPTPRGAVPLSALCEVRFGIKTGCNAFFHLAPLGPGRFRSALLGEVALDPADVAPLLAGLREARAPERCAPERVLFRPAEAPSPLARALIARGEAAGIALRPTCAGRRPWWRVAPGRSPAPLLYPAKIGARAFAVLNGDGLLEDKKWHALFPRAVPAWQLALALSATPVRLAIDERARQLTGLQAIADLDCGVLAAAPVPRAEALAEAAGALAPLRGRLALDEVTTDLGAMLDRPAQRELDRVIGLALGLSDRAIERSRRALRARVAARLAHGAAVRSGLVRGA